MSESDGIPTVTWMEGTTMPLPPDHHGNMELCQCGHRKYDHFFRGDMTSGEGCWKCQCQGFWGRGEGERR